MNPTETGSASGSPGGSEDSSIHSAQPPHLLPAGRVWAIAIACGLAAGLLAWAGGEAAHEAFRPRTFRVEVLGVPSVQPTIGTQNAADYKNATLAFSILGGAIGLMMGLAGGLASRSARRGIVVGAFGLLCGALVGALASLAILRIHYRDFVPDPNDHITPILVHGTIWTLVGAVGGAAFALGAGYRRQVANAVAGACFGAVAATLLFHVIGESFFPNSSYTDPVATSSPVRFIARALVALLVAIGAERETIRALPKQAPPGPHATSA